MALHLRHVTDEVTPSPLQVDPANPGAGPSGPATEGAAHAEVSVTPHMRAVVRVTMFRERPEGSGVYEASELLDRIARGEVPKI